MKICITGDSGFLGKHLSNYLAKKFNIVKVNLRKLPQKNTKDFNKFLKQITKSKIIINCAANLNPKNENDFFINESFPKSLSCFKIFICILKLSCLSDHLSFYSHHEEWQ